MQMRQTTKDLIISSFLELAETKPIDKITVREIAANCGITTATFYNHFRDKYDLIIWSYVNAGKAIMRKIGTNGYRWRDTLFESVRSFAERRDLLLNALHHTSGHDSFLCHMEKINIDLLSAEVKKSIEQKSLGTKTLTAEIEGAIRIYCYGTVRLIFDWLISDMPISPDDMARIMESSLPPPLAPYLTE